MRKIYSFILLFGLLLCFPISLFAQGELIPTDGANVIILSPSTYKIESGGTTLTFNGTINGNGVTLASLTIASAVTDHTVIILKNVITPSLLVEADAEVILELTGGKEANNLGEIVNNGDLFIKGDKFKFSEDVAAINEHFLTDSTASLRVVEGAGALIMGILEGSTTHNSEEGHLEGIVVAQGVSEVTFIWQKRDMLWWVDKDTLHVPGSKIFTCLYGDIKDAGEYRFRAVVERENSMTSLIHQNTAKVEIYHNVVLPEIEGATTDPAAGTHEVLDGTKFEFLLDIDKDYNESVPVVTTSAGETLTLNDNGYYTIKLVKDATTIEIDGIEPNNPASSIGVENNDWQVSTSAGQIEITTIQSEQLNIYSIIGTLKKNIDLPAGTTSVPMAPGLYIIQGGKNVTKVIVP